MTSVKTCHTNSSQSRYDNPNTDTGNASSA